MVDNEPRADKPPVGGDERRTPLTDPLRRSRTSVVWISVVALGILLVLLVVLILQNTQRVQVSFLGWEGHPPLAAALLVAAAGGILVTAIAGSLRILQLRRRFKRE
jgi:uncharacterized integral membrane protein